MRNNAGVFAGRRAWSVGQQLGAAFGAVVALVLLLALSAWNGIAALNGTLDTLVDQTLPAMTALSEVNDRLQRLRTAELHHLAALTMPAKDREEQVVKASAKALAEAQQRYQSSDASQQHGAQLRQLAQAIAHFNAERSTFLQMSNSAAGAEPERAVEASDYFAGPGERAYQGAYGAVQTLWSAHLAQADAAKAQSRHTAQRAKLLLAAVSLACSGLAVLLAVLISRHLLRQLGGQPAAVARVAQSVADADLSTPIARRPHDRDSVVAAMARMQESLTGIVSTVREGAHSVATASTEIAQGNHDLSHRTEHQASALQETAARMEELNTRVGENAHHAGQAKTLSQRACAVAEQGSQVMEQVVHTMNGIHAASRRIEDIIQVIDGIAFQTNILALNAAVEAARAGEQGRGFAVVASEVRGLAGRCAAAAKEIKQLIGASVQCVEQGNALVGQAGATMHNVVQAVRSVSDTVAHISQASQEQSTGVAQVGDAIRAMDLATQQNAALVEQIAAAASSLKMQAAELVQVVAVFALQDTPTDAALPALEHDKAAGHGAWAVTE
ncbi:MAG: methyl-accepting chemotaxis protein [Rhodoferax sp.]